MRKSSRGPILALVVLVLAFAGIAQATTITHLTYAGHGEDWLAFLQDRAKAFKAVEPDIDVDISVVAGGEYVDRFTVMAASGSAPDVTDFYPRLAGDLISKGYFRDLTPYVRRSTGKEPEDFFAGPTLDAVSYQGELWSLPVYINPRVTYFNADLFARNGLATPSELGDGWTWDAMRDSARKITKDVDGNGENDVFGIDNLHHYLAWQQLIHQAGGMLYDRFVSPTESRFNTEPVHQGIEFARRLMVDDSVEGGKITDGNAGISINRGPSTLAPLADVSFDWGMELEPLGPSSRAAVFGIGGFEVTKDSQNPEAAWKWVRFLTLDPDSARVYVETNGRIPALKQVQPEYADLVPALPPNWSALTRTVQQPNSFTLYVLTKNSSQIDSVVNGTLAQVWSGDMSTENALETIHEQVNALLHE